MRVVALAAAIAALVIAFVLVPGVRDGQQVAADGGAAGLPLLFDLPADSVVRITLQHEQQVSLSRRGLLEAGAGDDAQPQWVYTADPAVRLRRREVQRLAATAVGLRPLRLIAADATDLAAYGLIEPAVRVTLTTRDGAARTVLLGAPTPAGNRYAARAGSATVYTVGADAAFVLSAAPRDLIELALPTFEPATVRWLRLRRHQSEVVVVFDAWHDASALEERVGYRLIAPYPVPVAADDAAMAGVLQRLRADLTGDVADDLAPAGGTAQQHGLDQPAYELEIDDADGRFHLLVGAAAGASHRYARATGSGDGSGGGGGGATVLIGKSRVGTLDRLQPLDLVRRELADVDLDIVVAVRLVSDAGERVVTTSHRDASTGRTFGLDDEPLSAVQAAQLFETVARLRIAAEADPQAVPAEDAAAPVLAIRWTLRKSALPSYELAFYRMAPAARMARDFYLLERNGQRLFVVDRRAVDDLLELIGRLAD